MYTPKKEPSRYPITIPDENSTATTSLRFSGQLYYFYTRNKVELERHKNYKGDNGETGWLSYSNTTDPNLTKVTILPSYKGVVEFIHKEFCGVYKEIKEMEELKAAEVPHEIEPQNPKVVNPPLDISDWIEDFVSRLEDPKGNLATNESNPDYRLGSLDIAKKVMFFLKEKQENRKDLHMHMISLQKEVRESKTLNVRFIHGQIDFIVMVFEKLGSL